MESKLPSEAIIQEQGVYREGEEVGKQTTLTKDNSQDVQKPLYFSKITHSIGSNNNLQEAIINYVKPLERQFLTQEDANQLVKECKAKVAEFNQKFRRCKAESVRVYAGDYSIDISLYFGEYIFLQLYREKEVGNG